MTSARLVLIVVAGAGLLATAEAAAQIGRSSGPFDGMWSGESAKCVPAAKNFHFATITVANSSFKWAVAHQGKPEVCKIAINADGSFASGRDCAFQLSGKFEGKKLAVQLKTDERECNIAAKRQ